MAGASREKRRGPRTAPPAGPSISAAEAAQEMILIADDDETMRLVLQRALTGAGHLAIPVDDGGEIWPILERERVTTLVLDLNMTGVNGWEVLRRLRTDFQFRDRPKPIRVVVVSAQSDAETREFALRLGADAFLPKPLDLAELLAAVPRH